MLEDGTGIEVVETLTPADLDTARGEVVVLDFDGDASTIDTDGAPVVVLSDEGDTIRQSEAWPYRVRAILPRGAAANEIAAAVQGVAAGFVVMRPEEWERPQARAAAQTGVAGEGLTARETEVLRMVASGESNKRIAYHLGISEHTVKFHVASILAKLGAGSRAEAVAIGIRRGLLYV